MVVYVSLILLCLTVGGRFRPLLLVNVTFNVLLAGLPNTKLCARSL